MQIFISVYLSETMKLGHFPCKNNIVYLNFILYIFFFLYKKEQYVRYHLIKILMVNFYQRKAILSAL